MNVVLSNERGLIKWTWSYQMNVVLSNERGLLKWLGLNSHGTNYCRLLASHSCLVFRRSCIHTFRFMVCVLECEYLHGM